MSQHYKAEYMSPDAGGLWRKEWLLEHEKKYRSPATENKE